MTTALLALSLVCPTRPDLAPHVVDASHRYLLHPVLVVAVMREESRCRERAVSRKGARGLMQLLGIARNGLRGKALFDPRQNIMAGARWLALETLRCKSKARGLAAYATGQCCEPSCHTPKCRAGRAYARRVLARERRIWLAIEKHHLAGQVAR